MPTLFTDALPPPDMATERAYYDLYLRYRARGGEMDFPAYAASIGQMHAAIADSYLLADRDGQQAARRAFDAAGGPEAVQWGRRQLTVGVVREGCGG